MVNYQNGKIYKIVSSQTDKVYVGSTTKLQLSQRLAEHNYNYKKYTGGKTYFWTSFEIVMFEDAEIILVAAFPCSSKDELHARERYWIENIGNTVNKMRKLNITKEEKREYFKKYHQQHKQEEHEKRKQRYQNNREVYLRVLAHRKNRPKIVCECGASVKREGISAHKRTQKHINKMMK